MEKAAPFKLNVCKHGWRCTFNNNNSCSFLHPTAQAQVVDVSGDTVSILEGEDVNTYILANAEYMQINRRDVVEYEIINNRIYARVVPNSIMPNNSYELACVGNEHDYRSSPNYDESLNSFIKMSKLEQQIKNLEKKIDEMADAIKQNTEFRKRNIDLISENTQELQRINKNVKELYKHTKQDNKDIEWLLEKQKQNKRQRTVSYKSVGPAVRLLQDPNIEVSSIEIAFGQK